MNTLRSSNGQTINRTDKPIYRTRVPRVPSTSYLEGPHLLVRAYILYIFNLVFAVPQDGLCLLNLIGCSPDVISGEQKYSLRAQAVHAKHGHIHA